MSYAVEEYAAAGAEEQQSIGARLAEEDHAANSIQCAAVRRKMRLKAGDGGEGSGAEAAAAAAAGVSTLLEDAEAAALERAEIEARLAEEDRAALTLTRAASMRAKKIKQSTQDIVASAGGAAVLDATALIGYAAEAAAEQEAVAARLEEEDRAANTLQCAAVRRNMRLGGGFGGSGKRERRGVAESVEGEGEGDAATDSYLALLGDAGERAREDAAVAARLAEEEGAVGVIERAACARKLRSARFVPPAARAAQEEARDRQRRQAARQAAAGAMGRVPVQRSPAPPGGGGGGGFGGGGGGGGGGGYSGPSTHAAGSPLRARGLVSGAATAAPRGGGAKAAASAAHATEVAELRAQVAARDAQVAALQAENAKLKAQVHKLFG